MHLVKEPSMTEFVGKSEASSGDKKEIKSLNYRLSIACLFLALIGVVGLDQISKIQAEKELMVWSDAKDLDQYQGKRVPLLAIGERPPANPKDGRFFISLNLNYVRNQGAAWGAFSKIADNIRVPFFYGVTVVAVFMIFFFLKTTPKEHRLARYALTLILSGAIGNFIDRIRLGYVIDWIDVNWNILGWRYYFPNFNVADSAITTGVTFLLIDMLILEAIRQKKRGSLQEETATVEQS